MAVRAAYSRRYAPYPGVDIGRGATYVGTRVFIGNLNYSTVWQTLKDHCRRVGEVKHVDMLPGKDGQPSGKAIVEFALPEYAATAIRELNNTALDGRAIFVREDREEVGNFGSGPVRNIARPQLAQPVQPRAPIREFGAPQQVEDEPMDPVAYAKWYREWQERNQVGTAAYRSRFEAGRAPVPVERHVPLRPPPYVDTRPVRAVQPEARGPRVPGTKVFFGNLPFTLNWQALKDVLRESGFTDVHVHILESPEGRSKGCGLVTFERPEDAERAIQTFSNHVFEGRPMEVHLDKFAN